MSPTSLLGLAQLGAAQLGQVNQVQVQAAAFEIDGSSTVAFIATLDTSAAVQIDGSSTVSWTAQRDVSGEWAINGGSTVSWSGTVVSGGSVINASFHINGKGRVEWVPDGILPPGTITVPNYETAVWVDWNLIIPDADISEYVLTPSGVKWHYPMDGTLRLDFTVHAIGIDGHPSSMDVAITMVYFRPTNMSVKHDIGYQTAMFSTYHALMESPYPDGFSHPPDIPWSAPFATIDAILVGTEIILSVQGVDPDDNPTTDSYLSGPGIRNSDGRRHWAKREAVDVYPGLSSLANNRVSTF